MTDQTMFSLLEPLLQDAEIDEILIDSYHSIYIEKAGQLHDWPSPFENEAQIYALIREIAAPMGRELNESHPFVGLRLPDNSYVHIVIPPISLTGPSITIRRQTAAELTLADWLAADSLSPDMAEFLKACVQARLNIAIFGGVSSGKTQLTRALAQTISLDERLILLQKSDEITLPHRRLVRLETRPANLDGRGAVSMRDLVNNAIRMRPDRLILNEVDGEEVFDLALALSSGHDGALFNLYATNAIDAIERLEAMAALGSPSTPRLVLRERIGEMLDLLVQVERLKDGNRRITDISEMWGVDDGSIESSAIFHFQSSGFENGRLVGVFSPSGVIPQCLARLEQAGCTNLSPEMFAPVTKPRSLQRQRGPAQAAALDRQLGDTVWMMGTALRAGYSLRQVFEQLAAGPLPGGELWQDLLADLKKGFTFSECLSNLEQAVPSASLTEIVAVIQKQQQTGGNLAFMLEPVGEAIWKKFGSDHALEAQMRDLARSIGAELPPQLK